MLSPKERVANARIAVATRDGRLADADRARTERLDAAAERHEAAAQELRAYAAELAAQAPPLTPEQRARASAILRSVA